MVLAARPTAAQALQFQVDECRTTRCRIGPFDATGVTVSVQLPSAAQAVSAGANGGTCTIAATVATCVFEVANLADLSVAATGTASAEVGGTGSYTVTVANAGPDVAAAARLTVQASQGLTLATASLAGAACAVSASELITCALGDLASSKSVTVAINALLFLGTILMVVRRPHRGTGRAT